MCFWESRRTMKDGTLTICLPTLRDVRYVLDNLTMRLSVPDVSLADENTGVVDRLGETELVDTGLETALQEVLDLEGKDVIELHAGLVEDTDTDQTANEGVSFEKTLWVLLVHGQKLTVCGVSFACRKSLIDWNVAYRAARRILDRVSWTRQTSRLLRRPYSPTIFNSESLQNC